MSMSSVSGVAGSTTPTAPARIGLWPSVRSDRAFVVLFAGLVGLAWLGLVVWKASPYGRFLSHEEVGDVAPLSGDYLRLLVFFVAGWTLMTAAMMLPTSLPLFAFFRTLVRGRTTHASLVVSLVLGYVLVWTAFAAVVHANDQVIHLAVDRVGWLDRNSWLIAASTFATAGVYQFSSVKYRCLDKCRSPVGFVMAHWRDGRRTNAFALGVRHGLFCLGCCWSLMLLMFAVGVGNIAWMLLLAAVMATEKNVSWGRQLSAPLGVLLLAWAAVLAALGTTGLAG
jgi:predicted metal-binding membrane protein